MSVTPLRQSTATTQKLGPFLDPADGVTPLDSLTLTVKLGKAGGALTAKAEPSNPAHDADGFYDCNFNETDTNTVGIMLIESTNAGLQLPVWNYFFVLPQTVYDMFAGTGEDFATLAKQTEILTALESLSVLAGGGDVPVDHNYGGTGQLAYRTGAGVGINNATVRAYLRDDYEAGNRGNAYVVARTTTNVAGAWITPMFLDPEDYTLVYHAQGRYGPDTRNISVA